MLHEYKKRNLDSLQPYNSLQSVQKTFSPINNISGRGKSCGLGIIKMDNFARENKN